MTLSPAKGGSAEGDNVGWVWDNIYTLADFCSASPGRLLGCFVQHGLRLYQLWDSYHFLQSISDNRSSIISSIKHLCIGTLCDVL